MAEMLQGMAWTAVLNGGLIAAAYLAARYGLRSPAGATRALAASALGWAWLTTGVEALGAFGLLTRGPMLAWVAVGLTVGFGCRVFGRVGPVEGKETRPPWTWQEASALGLVFWGVAWLGALALLRPVKVVSDGPIYHLYFSARWWKAHRLDLIAAPFGENAATYFPAVGDLWFTWLTVGLGGDRLAKVGQAPFLGLSALAVYAAGRRLGAGRPASVLASAWFVTSTPFLIFSFEPNVDTIFVAGYLVAAYFFLLQALGDLGPTGLVPGALAAGCALGTKATGVVFVPPLLALGAASALARGVGVRGKLTGLLVVGLLPMTASGFYFGRNALLTGNPLYPLHLEAFGRVWLRGWYGPRVMRLSPYHLPMSDWRSLVDTVLAVLDPRLAPVWAASVAGVWAFRSRGGRATDRAVWAASALALANVGLYWLVIPYRTQQRFMFHALGLAALPLARAFDRYGWLRLAGLGLLAAHLLTPQWPSGKGEPPWDLSRLVPNRVGSPLMLPEGSMALAVALSVGAAALLAAWSWLRCVADPSARRRLGAIGSVALLVTLSLALANPWGADSRQRFFPAFRDYYRGWLEFDLRAGPTGARVAYAGTDLPYYLLGVGLRNEVRYVNVDGHPGWLLHDYQRASGGTTWPNPRPGWDRVRPDYVAWLANLRAERIQLLVVIRANPEEGPHNVADADGFPVERGWAEGHPETFVPLYGEAEGDPRFRLYRVLPPA